MRELFLKEDKSLRLKDYLNQNLSDFVIFKKGLNKIKIPLKNGFYEDENEERFYIYAGKGVLELKQCLKKYDFSHLNIFYLDYFLSRKRHYKHADFYEQKIINDFLELLNFNLKSKISIIPPYYERILNHFKKDKLWQEKT